ncbi:hypothetical protein RHGRI_023161 [Rhododendron griersonianum]|uniref:Ribosomal RNA-processing protein 7 C-terminal domain-containing protein n=1 Tax=Rhododendron griersonianum TaxID=479676 RepID=A0AAV6J286_9ERIC|nr:hypothetical protein RHGRI_023161 [Rhododendron griersonianum]
MERDMLTEAKPTGLKKIKKKDKPTETVPETNTYEVKEEKKRNKSLGQKRGVTVMGSRSKATVVGQHDIEAFKSDGALSEKNKRKLLRKMKRKRDRMNVSEIGKVDVLQDYVEYALDEQNGEHTHGKKEDGKLRKKGRRTEKTKKAGIDEVNVLCNKVEDDSKEENGKSRKARRSKKGHLSSKKEEKALEKSEPAQDEVYEISSGDEDCSRGMRKWITEYHQSRPGLEILQHRIDDFMTAYEEQEEQARKEQEALAAEGGWTVVVHHKGRKKTTDTESGIAVGSVAQAAVLEREAKKKSKTKDVGVDFYRFQKREAQRNEIMALQSKFEQDKKRIQQLRAARKFRPY